MLAMDGCGGATSRILSARRASSSSWTVSGVDAKIIWYFVAIVTGKVALKCHFYYHQATDALFGGVEKVFCHLEFFDPRSKIQEFFGHGCLRNKQVLQCLWKNFRFCFENQSYTG